MTNLGRIFLAGVLLTSLVACAKTEDANQPAAADTVEMPADELPSGDPSMAAPAAAEGDAMAPAADGSDAADAAQSAADSAKAAAEEAKAAKAASGAKPPAGN